MTDRILYVYVSSCAGDPDRIQKAMVVCSNRKIAYALLQKFKDKYPEWFEEKKSPDGVSVTEEELKQLKPTPFIAMVSSVGSNDEEDMYNYLGGVKNDKRSEELDAAFKQEKSNFHIVIVVDMWITGFDVPCLTYLYNDKPLKKHLLIQTISRVNRKYPGKEFGMVVDYIGIRDNMREAMKIYGGDTSVAPTSDDVEQATSVFREEMLEKTIEEYHERRKHLTAEEAGETQEKASEDIIKIATEQALAILRQMNENRESFRKIGLTFEEKAFYDILISLRDQYNFEYGTDKEVDGVVVNDKCKALAKKIKDIIDTKSSFADWLNNQNVRNQLKLDIKICLVKNGYPPQYSPEVFNKVMEQVENFEEYSVTEDVGNEAATSAKIYQYEPEYKVMKVAEDSAKYGK